MSRLAPIDVEKLDEEQRRVHDAVLAGPRGRVTAQMPFWLRSPGLADPAQRLGAFLRFESELPAKLRELAILVTARATTAQVEWCIHRPIAETAGLSPAIADAIAARAEPVFTDEDEALTYALARALCQSYGIGEALFGRGLARFGEKGMVELVGLVGYYTMVAMTLNAFDADLPEGMASPLSS
ncbi:MAG TPA: carboxymuconolactone decarboxylase family protein [Acetobacteraceae bacterium]|jgi:4-carboxymuconolactone decarboxylase|nr:carboxymuconolactone decarboxylase family protein [Acetobacteraceae bacterium]